MSVRLAALGPDTFEDFARFHDLPECQGCYCMYWDFEGDNRLWQLSLGPAQREQKRLLVEQERAYGMLAYEGDAVVGTLQCAPRDGVTKLLARMPYRGLERDEGTWSILCFRVLEARRRQGVAKALLWGALEYLREQKGARAVEAYPRRGDELHDAEHWQGPEQLYLDAGFAVSREHGSYPVLRRAL